MEELRVGLQLKEGDRRPHSRGGLEWLDFLPVGPDWTDFAAVRLVKTSAGGGAPMVRVMRHQADPLVWLNSQGDVVEGAVGWEVADRVKWLRARMAAYRKRLARYSA